MIHQVLNWLHATVPLLLDPRAVVNVCRWNDSRRSSWRRVFCWRAHSWYWIQAQQAKPRRSPPRRISWDKDSWARLGVAVPVHHRANDKMPAGLTLFCQAQTHPNQRCVLSVLICVTFEGADAVREATLVIVRLYLCCPLVVFLVFLFANWCKLHWQLTCQRARRSSRVSLDRENICRMVGDRSYNGVLERESSVTGIAALAFVVRECSSLEMLGVNVLKSWPGETCALCFFLGTSLTFLEGRERLSLLVKWSKNSSGRFSGDGESVRLTVSTTTPVGVDEGGLVRLCDRTGSIVKNQVSKSSNALGWSQECIVIVKDKGKLWMNLAGRRGRQQNGCTSRQDTPCVSTIAMYLGTNAEKRITRLGSGGLADKQPGESMWRTNSKNPTRLDSGGVSRTSTGMFSTCRNT